MPLTAARLTGPTSRPRWRSSILGSSTRSSFFDGVPNHAISPARARNGHGSCGKRSADSAFPTSSHSRCYSTHINEPARRGKPERVGRVVKSSVHETMGSLTWGAPVETCPGLGTPAAPDDLALSVTRVLPSASLTASASATTTAFGAEFLTARFLTVYASHPPVAR
jgi:hypothetical protein